jgi:hypothetical protein
MPFPKALIAPVLDGDLVRLEPLGHRHAADLARQQKKTGRRTDSRGYRRPLRSATTSTRS